MGKWISFVLLAAALLFGCGGGGSSVAGTPEQPQSFQLGLVRSDLPTTVLLQIAKPFYPEGTVELAEAPLGAFQIASPLPLPVPGGHEASLGITFTPPAAPADATQEGTIQLLFRSANGGRPVPVTLQLRAQVESPSARLVETQASAGNVVVGQTARFGVWFENTSAVTPVTVTTVTAPDGDFSIDPDAYPLPALVAPRSRFFVWFQYSPQSLGNASSLVRISHSASASPLEATLTGSGTEDFEVRFQQASVSAGNVVVGETVEFGMYVENTSALTPVTVTGVTVDEDEFSLAPGAVLPLQIDPGSTLYIPLVYSPREVWDASASVRVYHSGPGAALAGAVTGTGIAAQVVYGNELLLDADTGTYESAWQDVYVPTEAVSIFLEVKGDPSSVIDLIGFEGPDGVVYENDTMTGPLGWMSYYPAGINGYLTVALPSSDQPEVQLVPGGGWYRFRLRDSSQAADRLAVRVIVTQRTGGAVQEGTLDVRVFLAAGLGITDLDLTHDTKLAHVMKTIDAILGLNDIRLGSVSFASLDSSYDTLSDEALLQGMMASNTAGQSQGSLNLFLVTDIAYGIAGTAGATPGPWGNGTPYSGVVIDFDESDDGIIVGAFAAHEIGHYLGSIAEDVLLQPAEAYAALRHPLLSPGLPQLLLSPPESTDYGLIDERIADMEDIYTWCGISTKLPVR